MTRADGVVMTQTLELQHPEQVVVEPPPLPQISLLRPALLLHAATAISLAVGTIPLSGLNPFVTTLFVPVGAFVVAAVRVAKDPTRFRSVRWLRRLEKVWIAHFVVNFAIAAFVAGMWLNPTQFLTGLILPLWILKMTKEYTHVVSR